MMTFVLLIKFSTEHAKNYASMQKMGMEMREKYMRACPGIKLLDHHLYLSGPYDFMHLYEAPDLGTAFKMSSVIRASEMVSSCETWPALKYQELVGLVKDI